MLIYETETQWGLILASLPALFSAYFYFIRDKKQLAVILLMGTALLLRLVMIFLDPYIHEWDERFHALVAKSMMDTPFRPLLFPRHIMAYDMENWAYTHIWVHKQPVFLWQMALSMKIFGVSPWAVRLPSAILGAIMVWLTYDMARKWIRIDAVAFMAAFITAFAYYALELISGWRSLEHNDLIFTFYMTCTFWAFTRYVHAGYALRWAVWIGIFAGLAILNKWLTGLLIFGGWGLYLLQSVYKKDLQKYAHLGLSVLITCVVFMPWQLYIRSAFPEATAIAYKHNRMHMTGTLGHPGTELFHFEFLPVAYHTVLLIFLAIGIWRIFYSQHDDRKLTVSFLSMTAVLFLFFSLFVATKMPAFVYPASSILIILMAFGLYITAKGLFDYWQLLPRYRNEILFILIILTGYISLKPHMIIQQRAETNAARNNKIHNARIFQSLDDEMLKERVVLNTRPYENIELMFYKDALAYHWYPEARVLDSLQALGHKFAAFQYSNDPQQLPDYIANDPEVLVLKEKLR